MQIISVPDANDSISRITIDGEVYRMRWTWNMYGGFWTFHLWDKDDNPIVTNIKAVCNFPLLMNKHWFNVPKGEFIVATELNSLGRYSFYNEEAKLVYMTEGEFYDK